MRSALDIGPTFLERSGIQPFTGTQGKSVVNNAQGHSGVLVEEDSQQPMAAFDNHSAFAPMSKKTGACRSVSRRLERNVRPEE